MRLALEFVQVISRSSFYSQQAIQKLFQDDTITAGAYKVYCRLLCEGFTSDYITIEVKSIRINGTGATLTIARNIDKTHNLCYNTTRKHIECLLRLQFVQETPFRKNTYMMYPTFSKYYQDNVKN